MTVPPDQDDRPGRRLTDEEYRRLAELRHGQRRFLHWSGEQAKAAGLTPTQHQLLLGIRAFEDARGPTISDVAEFLFLRHHSAVELALRASNNNLVMRHRDPDEPSMVRLRLTEDGAAILDSLTELHFRELAELAPTMSALWDRVAEVTESDVSAGPAAHASGPRGRRSPWTADDR